MDHIILFGLLNVCMYFCAVFHSYSVWSDASLPSPSQSLACTVSLDKVLQRGMHSTEPRFLSSW